MTDAEKLKKSITLTAMIVVVGGMFFTLGFINPLFIAILLVVIAAILGIFLLWLTVYEMIS